MGNNKKSDTLKVDKEDREQGNSWGARSNENVTGRGLFFASVQRWGRAVRRVHQIFIRASVHSLEAHYGTKAAENILEEQLNKKKKWLIYRPRREHS